MRYTPRALTRRWHGSLTADGAALTFSPLPTPLRRASRALCCNTAAACVTSCWPARAPRRDVLDARARLRRHEQAADAGAGALAAARGAAVRGLQLSRVRCAPRGPPVRPRRCHPNACCAARADALAARLPQVCGATSAAGLQGARRLEGACRLGAAAAACEWRLTPRLRALTRPPQDRAAIEAALADARQQLEMLRRQVRSLAAHA